MAQQDAFFAEDLVRSTRTRKLGVVLRVYDDDAEQSESDSEDGRQLEPGTALVRWDDNSSTAVNFSRLELLDRAVLPGDIVFRRGDNMRQTGTVLTVQQFLSLQAIPKGARVVDIPSHRLRYLSPYTRGYFVTHASWLGRIEDSELDVLIRFPDGGECWARSAIDSDLDVETNLIASDDDTPFAPGMRVTAPPHFFRSCEWIRGSFRRHQFGLVVQVVPTIVWVQWITSCNNSAIPPPSPLEGSLLTILETPDQHCSWQRGDKGVFFVSPQMPVEAEPDAEWVDEEDTEPDSTTRRRPLHPRRSAHGVSRVGAVAKRARHAQSEEVDAAQYQGKSFVTEVVRSVAEVLWQDGTVETGIASTSLFPAKHVGTHDFSPNDFVSKISAGENRSLGLVKKVDAQQRMATVLWLRREDDVSRVDQQEELSVYEITMCYDYRIGDPVLNLSVTPQTPQLKRFGVVMSFTPQGAVIVQWADRERSEMRPDELLLIDLAHQPEIDAHDDGWDEEEDSGEWEDDSAEGEDQLQRQQTNPNPRTQGQGPAFPPGDYASMFNDFFGYMREMLVGQQPNTQPQPQRPQPQPQPQTQPPTQQQPQSSISPATSTGAQPATTPSPLVSVTAAAAAAAPASADVSVGAGVGVGVGGLQNFSFVAEAPSDHFYLSKPSSPAISRSVQKEYKLLRSTLTTKGISVIAFENRMDLFRAVMLGPANTPYMDGLFVFDIYLPPTYPNDAPLVHYFSFEKEKLNPNLYTDGTVCLSLLGTWAGNSVESWNPGKSNIVQVVLSIQALVLNTFPYFNEAGYEKQRGSEEGERNALFYNESAYLLMLRAMSALLMSPPAHVNECVRSHFRERGPKILKYMEYLLKKGSDSAAAFELEGDEIYSVHFDKLWNDPPSAGFLRMLSQLSPILQSAFASL
eukprot:TRINITY_DN5235_c0_g1_i1.p1 TRINITY_DN5235_c0_g1~~TRINITY_DN5235_c0_g1_i1.p1  ORF type:complete len:912 (-),score=190.68 TRINITY_DN5235_c0_g1_i1:12-2747(-)